MPIVTIQITRDGISPAQKNQLIAGATRLMQEVLQKDPEKTFVIIEEVATEDWGVGGKSVADLRRS